MTTWRVTLKTGPMTWSSIELHAGSHTGAIAHARRILGNFPVTEVK